MIEITPCSGQGDFKAALDLVRDHMEWLDLDLLFQDIHQVLSKKKNCPVQILDFTGKVEYKGDPYSLGSGHTDFVKKMTQNMTFFPGRGSQNLIFLINCLKFKCY